ncbi:craniofacial development protein 2-like [Schistocerca piceifrons]|uniref:craniofacial development protein 2-like n=1 Tax=Schistocerca piceifrons TaxID=274613 RepID=UPI001F5E5BB1|nr:craniofacial development protein 2-like [Schistocerca piceifrons]
MIGVWNVRTLQDNDHNQCPERKTGLNSRELARYNIDITAISETHLSDSGQLCEPLGGYTYYWSGKSSTERAESGVGFAIRNKLACSLTELPKGISDRIITLRLHLASKKYLHLINVYAPTLPSPDEEKNKFYQDLRRVLRDIPSADKLLLLGDFNVRVGNDFSAWNGVLGRHGIGKCNSNGLDLLTLCAEFELCLTNTYFRLPEKYKTTWMHPRSKHWHLLDYVIVRKKDLGDVLVTRAMRGAQGWTDHRLVRSKLKITLKTPRRASHKIPTKLSCKILANDQTMRAKQDEKFGVDGLLTSESATVDEQWSAYASRLRGCASEVLGKPQKKHQDWFDDSDPEIRKLINDLRTTSLRTPDDNKHRAAHYNLKVKVRALKDS